MLTGQGPFVRSRLIKQGESEPKPRLLTEIAYANESYNHILNHPWVFTSTWLKSLCNGNAVTKRLHLDVA